MRTLGFVLLTLLTTHLAQAAEGPQSIQDYLKLGPADRIVVTYAPKANFNAGVKSKEVTEAKVVKEWLAVCHQIPAASPRRLLVKFAPRTPEHRIEFYQGKKHLGTLGMKGRRLDAPAGDGWDFYSLGEDQALIAHVEALMQPSDKKK